MDLIQISWEPLLSKDEIETRMKDESILIHFRSEENKDVKYPNIDKFPKNIARLIRTLDQRTGMMLCSGEFITSGKRSVELRYKDEFGILDREIVYDTCDSGGYYGRVDVMGIEVEYLSVRYRIMPVDLIVFEYTYQGSDLADVSWNVDKWGDENWKRDEDGDDWKEWNEKSKEYTDEMVLEWIKSLKGKAY